MKGFLEFIAENKEAPYGVIFDKNRVYVGSPHDKNPKISAELKDTIIKIAKEHGVWYEGDGGDIKSFTAMFGSKKSYKGSWDDELAKEIEGYPMPFMSPFFSNVDVNKQYEKIVSDKSIFDSLLSSQDKLNYFKDKRKFDSKQLTTFLKYISEKGVDFIELSRLPATKENAKKFFKEGEKLAWPKNWQEYPNKLGKLVKQSEEIRNNYLLKADSGVYVVGAGHLIELMKMNKSLKMIGGELADS